MWPPPGRLQLLPQPPLSDPKCQGLGELRWVERQQQGLLPVGYHHVVFTVPEALHPPLRRSPRLGYGLLFAAVAETLLEVAQRPNNLGARIGFTTVLHTWSQLLGRVGPWLRSAYPGTPRRFRA